MAAENKKRFTIALVRNNDNVDIIVDKVTTRIGWDRSTALCRKLNEGLGYVYKEGTDMDMIDLPEGAVLFGFY